MTAVTTSCDFFPTEEELALVAQIYERAGCSRPGFIEGETVAELFTASVELQPPVLGAIWDIADELKSGYLSETGLAIALRLIGWAQSGQEVTADLVTQSGPLPNIKGLSKSDADDDDWPPFTEDTRESARKLFEESGPVYGLLEGDKARDAFLMFDLVPKDIWKIWEIADTRKRGALDKCDFALALYLIDGLKSGRFASIPSATPSSIYEQIRAAPTPSISATPSPKVPDIPDKPKKPIRPPPSPIVTQFATQPPEKTPLSSVTATGTQKWDVSQSAKESANKHFSELDTLNVGYIEGDVIVSFLNGFDLAKEDLAFIWELADLNHDGRLTREEFTIALHLAEQRLNGIELPVVLPISLIPPSLRRPANPRLHRSASSPTAIKKPHPQVVTRSRIVTISESPPLPPKPQYPQWNIGRHSVAIPNGATIPPKSPPPLRSRHSLMIPPVTSTKSPPLAVIKSNPEPQVVPLEEHQSLKQQNTRLTAEIENLTAKLRAQQDTIAEDYVPKGKYQTLEDDNYRLSATLKDLTAQVKSYQDTEHRNKDLSDENARLNAKILEIEQITEELLQSNEATALVEQLQVRNAELERRATELEQLRPQLEDASRRLEAALQENRDLGARIREVREAADKESNRLMSEVDGLENDVVSLEEENESLRKRIQELQESIMNAIKSGSSSSTVNPEMEILMRDLTRENENLKRRLREMETSTANLLLSTNGHAEQENLRRDNQRLQLQLQDIEQLLVELQRSSEEHELQRVLKDVTLENEELKGNLRAIRTEVTDLQQTARKVEPLEAEVEQLREEIRRLHSENVRRQAVRDEGGSAPPPAYDDDPFH